MKLRIALGLELPNQEKQEHYRKPSPEERVKEALEMVNSNADSYVEWEFLRKVYNQLLKKIPRSEKVQNLIDMMEPTMDKFGKMDSHKKVMAKTEVGEAPASKKKNIGSEHG